MMLEKNANKYWSDFIPGLFTKGVDEALNALYLRNEPLNRLLRQEFSKENGPYSIISTPVFEALFPWKTTSKTYSDLAKSGLLSQDTLEAISKNDKPCPKSRSPYIHQLQSYELLLDKSKTNSIVVSSGTGSGKTECFLIPLIEDLVRERAAKGENYESGVRAIFLYPLNALIDSQLERLQNWTRFFNGDIRFCRFNSKTEKLKVKHIGHPEEVVDRPTMREKPADMLLTNPSMLERMLLNRDDRPIIEKTKRAKSFRWVIIDEAHTYLGSKAANLALLLRRVLNAFGVDPADVHFVATSATVDASDKEACDRLKKFLIDLSGTNPDQVHLILGKRNKPSAQIENPYMDERDYSSFVRDLDLSNDKSLIDAFKGNRIASRIRNHFIESDSADLNEIKKISSVSSSKEILQWLDLLTIPHQSDGSPYLPLRLHLMMNSTAPLYACPDPECPHKQDALKHKDWHFGSVWFDGRTTCECGAPLLPIVACSKCNGISLKANHTINDFFESEIYPIVDDHESEALWIQAQRQGIDDVMIAPSTDGFTRPSKENESTLDDETLELSVDDLEPVPTSRSAKYKKVLICKEGNPLGSPAVIRWVNQGIEETRTVYFIDDEDGNSKIPCPHCKKELEIKFFYQRSLSQRYLNHLIPYILEFSSSGVKNKNDLPMAGRRLISFTDSRQGTARTSALIEREGERSFIAKIVYRELLKAKARTSSCPRFTQEQIDANPDPQIRALLMQANAANESNQFVKWSDLVRTVAEELCTSEDDPKPQRAMVRSLWGTKSFDSEHRYDVARILLLREFVCRPINGMSLETCGLVSLHYSSLSKINAPIDWRDLGKSDEEWRAFLKIILDFYVRQNHCVEMPRLWKRLGGNQRIYGKTVVSFNAENYSRTQTRWPLLRNKDNQKQHQIIDLLARFLGIDLSIHGKFTEKGKLIDDLMKRAYFDLTNNEILKASSITNDRGGYVIDYDNQVSIKLNDEAWLFEGQNKLFDTIVGNPSNAICPIDHKVVGAEKVRIPNIKFSDSLESLPIDVLWSEHSEQARAEVRQFMNTNQDFRFLYESGIWNRLGTYALEQTGYFAAGEHSGQVEEVSKELHVSHFKKGLLNVLACSTTMEMGVDLDDISTVLMTDVPPHPANYMQRAGRAGRRGESRANAITLCHSNARDREVFKNPSWALDGKQPSLYVALNSEKIIKQHIQASLLSYFFDLEGIEDKVKLTLDTWFKKHLKKYQKWLEHIVESKCVPNDLREGISSLIRNSKWASSPIEYFLESAHKHMDELSKSWVKTYKNFNDQINDPKNEAVVVKALTNQLDRFRNELVYDTLTKNSYLPSTIVVQGSVVFNKFTTVEESYEKKKEKKVENADLPSRDSHVAIYEYAPGASVLIDNKVFTSSGITLNWKVPINKDFVKNELQEFKHMIFCDCGHKFFVEPGQRGDEDLKCPQCGSKVYIDGEGSHEVIVPVGYSVDESHAPHNDYSKLTTFNYSDSVCSVSKPWNRIENSTISFRSDSMGQLISYNQGFGKGYHICLCCGWAKAVEDFEEDNLKHQPLRKAQNAYRDAENFCQGSDRSHSWRMKSGVYLAAESRTDCIEFAFDDVNCETLERRPIALGIGVALRHVICSWLGIETSEIGLAVRRSGSQGLIVSLFDRNNSGYCSSPALSNNIMKLLEQALSFLNNCPNGCASTCSSCLLTFDTRRDSQHMNRFKSAEILSKAFKR